MRFADSICVTVPESSTVTNARSPVGRVTVFFVARWRRKLNP
jgi:poly-beta-hydroxyalkanoate depolymerase